MRKIVFGLLSCAVFSAILLTNAPSEARADTGQAAVEEATAYLGAPYGVGGLDCSGFTSAVYADLGVYLPDSPGAQYAYGTPSSAEAGDLVFSDEHGYGISHVGIATGYGTMIHASTYYGAVVEAPIDSVPGYVGAVDVY
jgi:cell wall-associated NlpC family hydrolase